MRTTYILKNILRTPFMRNLLIACLALAIGLPLYCIFFFYPSFAKLALESAQNEAIQIATYLESAIVTINDEMMRYPLPDHLIRRIEKVKRNFQLEHLNIFSNAGENIYSSDSKYIGTIHPGNYFHEVVARGSIYSKVLRKGSKSLERRVVTSDVVETYVPLIRGKAFIGAFEIYYDIATREEMLDKFFSRSMLTLFAMVSGLLIAVFAILFRASKTSIERKREEEALERSEAGLRVLTSQLFTTQEEERKRLALEIEDGIGQNLAAIKYRVEAALQEMGQKRPEKGLKSLDPVVPVVMETVEKVRKILMELRPSILDELGLLSTISWLCREVETIHPGIQIRQKIEVQETDVPDSLKIVIFRVMQEALNNIAKHSQANLAFLALKRTKSRIEFTINDNGVGFDVDCVMSGDPFKIGFGLLTMKERVELSGGSFLLKSQTGSGTTVSGSWQC